MEECGDDLENLLSRCLHSVRVTDSKLANKGVKQSQLQIRARKKIDLRRVTGGCSSQKWAF